MISALEDLSLAKLWVVYPGNKTYLLHERVEAMPFNRIPAQWHY